MIQWEIKNASNTSFDKIEESKEYFLKFLGPFKMEFDEKNGFVTIDCSKPMADRFQFTIGIKYDLPDFIMRHQVWNKGKK